jgi:hypothetical protein
MIKDEEILKFSSNIAKSFRINQRIFPLDELINEGFVAAKVSLQEKGETYQFAISQRIRGAILDFISANNHTSLPSNLEGEEQEVEDLSYQSISEEIFSEDVIKIIRSCFFYNEPKKPFPSLSGRGLELLYDRFVFSLSLKQLSEKYGSSSPYIQIKLEEILCQLRIAVSQFLSFKGKK